MLPSPNTAEETRHAEVPVIPVVAVVNPPPADPQQTDNMRNNMRRVFYGAGIIVGLRQVFGFITEEIAEDAPFLETMRHHLVRSLTFIAVSTVGLLGSIYFGRRRGQERVEEDGEEIFLQRQAWRQARRQALRQREQNDIEAAVAAPEIAVQNNDPGTVVTPVTSAPLQQSEQKQNQTAI